MLILETGDCCVPQIGSIALEPGNSGTSERPR